jgi:hypothetical protein
MTCTSDKPFLALKLRRTGVWVVLVIVSLDSSLTGTLIVLTGRLSSLLCSNTPKHATIDFR